MYGLTAKYAVISSDYQLLSWTTLTASIYCFSSGQLETINYHEFCLLLLADGQTAIDQLPERDIVCFDRLAKKGIVQICNHKVKPHDNWFRIYNNRCVVSAFFSLTGKCNYHCRHCLMDAPKAKLGESSLKEILALVDDMERCGIHRIDLTGGEPLLRTDIYSIIDKITLAQMKIGCIYTNGSLLEQQLLNYLNMKNQKPAFAISFDGTSGWHDWMRGEIGAEEKAITAIKLCVKNGYQVRASLCLHKGNIPELRRTVNFLASLGVTSVKIGAVSNSDLWKQNNDGNTLSTMEYFQTCIDYIPQFYEDACPVTMNWGGIIQIEAHSGKYVLVNENKEEFKYGFDKPICNDFRTTCYITPDLRLLPCMGMTETECMYEYPTIKECGGFANALDHPIYKKATMTTLKEYFEHNEECARCEYKLLCCGGCRANAMCDNCGDFWAKDIRKCEIWKNGYPDLVSDIAQKTYLAYKS